MQQHFTDEEKVWKAQVVNTVYRNIAKQQFILKFLKKLPLEQLERLVDFKEIDEDENILKFTAELWLDDGVPETDPDLL